MAAPWTTPKTYADPTVHFAAEQNLYERDNLAFLWDMLFPDGPLTSAVSVTVPWNGKPWVVLYLTASVTVRLPPAALAGSGFLVSIRGGSGVVFTVDPDGSEQINAAATYTSGTKESAIIVCSGTAWWVMASR